MTETTTTLVEPQPEATAASVLPLHPSDILMNLIVAFLASMFLGASAGDIQFARMAAIETVNAYRARNQADLIAIAQIVAYGLAALGSLSLSMTDNISLSMTLRLRGNANALNRSAEQNRRPLEKSRADNPMPHHPEMDAEPETDDELNPAALLAGVTAARKLAAEAQAQAHTQAEKPAADQRPGPMPVATLATPVSVATLQNNRTWAAAMIDAAEKMTAGLHNLPPAERKVASIRAAALTSTASELLAGLGAPPLRPIIQGPAMPPGAT